MPPLEFGITNPKLAQFTDSFIAPKRREREVSDLLETCQGYAISEGGVPLEHPEEDYTEYFYQTVSEGNIRLRIHGLTQPKFSYVNGNAPEMRVMEDELARSQTFAIPNKRGTNEWDHASGMFFIVQNITTIDGLLTNNPGTKRIYREPKWFMENEIPSPDDDKKHKSYRTDLILVGSDNRFRILEHHKNQQGKVRKAKMYESGLQRMYQKETHKHLPPNRVLSYIVQYHEAEDAYEMDIKLTSLFIQDGVKI